MKKVVYVFFFAALLGQQLFAQTCATPFTPGSTSLVETCTPSGVAGPYTIIATATTDSAFTITGLWELPTGTVTADIDCNAQTFTIARQPINPSFELQGNGYLSGNNVIVNYQIYQTGDSNYVDVCTATYFGTTVGTTAAMRGTSAMLYPNPATDRTVFIIKGVSTVETIWTYRIMDMQGRELTQGTLGDQGSVEIAVGSLTKGIYHVVAQDETGQMVSKALVVR